MQRYKKMFGKSKKSLPLLMYKISKTCGITIYIFTFYKKDFIEKNYVFCGGDSKTLTKLFPGI